MNPADDAPSVIANITSALRATSREKWAQRVFSLFISIGLLALVLWQVDWVSFGLYWSRLSSGALFISLAFYLALNIFRALRFRALLAQPDLPQMALLPITLYHNFLVRLLPFKLGEVSYVLLLKQKLGVPSRAGISSLFAARLLELLVIVVVAVFALLESGDLFSAEQWTLVLALMLSSLALVSLALMGAGPLLRLLVRPWSGCSGWRSALHARLMTLAQELDDLRQPRRLWPSLLWSVFTYMCSALSVLATMWALDVRLSLLPTVIFLSLGMFALAFPFNISGFGLVDLSWAFGLMALANWPAQEAVAAGFMLNATQMLFAVVGGLLAYVWLYLLPSPKPTPKNAGFSQVRAENQEN
ncbi:MAG: flippase-like domain-containing protein [Anaerolineae bacterium]|nr:flippase-like domain-containing protein [Anaerolineae bacterium]MDW8170899.1 lysylphosphatidylglycerol synthase transmembrane domain-containing protein [Anaerolineae bacterium]